MFDKFLLRLVAFLILSLERLYAFIETRALAAVERETAYRTSLRSAIRTSYDRHVEADVRLGNAAAARERLSALPK